MEEHVQEIQKLKENSQKLLEENRQLKENVQKLNNENDDLDSDIKIGLEAEAQLQEQIDELENKLSEASIEKRELENQLDEQNKLFDVFELPKDSNAGAEDVERIRQEIVTQHKSFLRRVFPSLITIDEEREFFENQSLHSEWLHKLEGKISSWRSKQPQNEAMLSIQGTKNCLTPPQASAREHSPAQIEYRRLEQSKNSNRNSRRSLFETGPFENSMSQTQLTDGQLDGYENVNSKSSSVQSKSNCESSNISPSEKNNIDEFVADKQKQETCQEVNIKANPSHEKKEQNKAATITKSNQKKSKNKKSQNKKHL